MFSKFNALPSIKQIQFTKGDTFEIRARYASEGDLAAGSKPAIATFTVSGLPEGVVTKQKVKVKLDANGLLSMVSAYALEEEGDGKDSKDMDVEGAVSATTEAEAKETDDKKKKKYKKTELSYVGSFAGGFAAADLAKLIDTETAHASHDRLVAETMEKRNDLEAYVYDIRAELTGELAPFVLPATVATLNTACTDAEDWLSTDEGMNALKAEYAARLAALKAISDPIKFRKTDAEARPLAQSQLKAAFQKYQLQATSQDVKYAHIDAADKGRILTTIAEGEAWLAATAAKQEQLPSTADPVLLSSDMDMRRKNLVAMAEPILTKPVPPPPKVTPAAAPAPATPAAAEPQADTPMDDAKADAPAAPAKDAAMDLDCK